MKAVMVMFDSLNRHMLPPYGCEWIKAPNFARLAKQTVTFETSYVCSMPCMPARRDLHTGRPNFMHRPWGPLEPFDDSVPELLKQAGVYTHLATDHYHYFEDGGATYHPRYSTWDFFRGQEGDPYFGQVADPDSSAYTGRHKRKEWHSRQDLVNRTQMKREADQPQAKTFAAGLDFIRRNHNDDKWFLQLETFDPHEPFFTQEQYQKLYPHKYNGPLIDWPDYRRVGDDPPELVEHLRLQYASLLSMCDAHLGKVLDLFDELSLWEDTMLIVWTDHGFLLGEQAWWGKMRAPFYEEIAHTPFFVWDPRSRKRDERRQSLVQPSIDLGPTLLDFFGLSPTKDMLGQVLSPVIERDAKVRDYGVFGLFGAQMNVTDGQYVYWHAPDPMSPLNQYTLMPGRMNTRWPASETIGATVHPPLSFTKNAPVLCVSAGPPGKGGWYDEDIFKTFLWDVQADPKQQAPIDNPAVQQRMKQAIVTEMKRADAPVELYDRLRLQSLAATT